MKIQSTRRAVRAPLCARNRFASAARGTLMLGTALGCSIAIMAGAPGTAWAGDECGDDVGGVITCTATSGVGNPYPNGIGYVGDAGEDITVVLSGAPGSAVNVNSGGFNGVTVINVGGYDADLIIESGAIVVSTANGVRARGYATGSDAYVYNAGDVTGGTRGEFASASNASATVINAGSVAVIGASNGQGVAIGMQANSYGALGVSTVSNTGLVTVTGASNDITRGLEAGATAGTASIYNAGAVDVSADAGGRLIGAGVFSGTYAGVTTTVDGTIDLFTAGTGYAYGIYAHAYTGDVVINAAGAITVTTAGSGTGISAVGGTTVYISAGDVTVTGINGAAVRGSAAGLVEIIANGDITATGNSVEGIAAYSNTGIEITALGAISTAGVDAEGIRGRGYNTADVTIVTAGITTTGLNSEGVYAVGNGNIDVTTNGLISTAGDNSYGVLARSFGAGEVYVSVDQIITSGDNSEGVWAFGNNDVTVIALGDVTTEGNYSTGLYAGSYGAGLVTVDAATVSTTGFNSDAIFANSNSGAVAVSFDGLTTTGAGSDGVQALAETGVSVIGAGAVDAAGMGVYAQTTTGYAYVSVEDVTAYGLGVRVIANTGYATVETGAIDVNGSFGVQANGGAGVSVTVTGDVGVDAGEGGATGVYAQADDGLVSIVLVGDTVVSAPGRAVGVEVNGADDGAAVDVTGSVSAATTGDRAYGVLASAEFGLIEIDVTGAVTADGHYQAFGVQASFDASAPPAKGEGYTAAYGDAQTIDITIGGLVTALSEYGTATGVYASAADGVIIDLAAVTATAAYRDATGVDVFSSLGEIVASTGDLTVYAFQTAFGMHAYGFAVSVSVTGDIEVTAKQEAATGVWASASEGEASIVMVGDTVVDAGGVAIGVDASSYAGGVSVDVTGAISATSSGAQAYGVRGYAFYGDVAIEVSGAINADANDNAIGVLVAFGEPEPYYYYYYYGRQTVVSGDVTAALGDPQTVEVTVGGLITVHSDYGVAAGVRVTADDMITVETAGIMATADAGSAFGLDLDSNYGDISVTVNGDLTISAPGGSSSAFGMDLSAGGAIDVVMTGDIEAQGGWAAYGVLAQGYGTVSVDIDGAITVDAQGNATGVRADSQYGSAYAYVVDVDVFAYGTAVGVNVEGQTGATAVSTGQVISSGVGVNARSNTGAASATVVDVTAGSDAVWAISNYGDAIVIATGEIISVGAGLSAWTGSGDANVTNDGSVVTSGDFAYGIRATTTSGDVHVDSDGTVETNGDSAIGILATTVDGDITISFDQVSTFGDAVLSFTSTYYGEGGEGGLRTVFEYATGSHGIVATSQYGSVDIQGGDVFTDGDGAKGIIAQGYGSVLIDVGTVQTQGNPLLQMTTAYGDYYNVNSGAIGIDARVRGGDLSIYADAVYTAGDQAHGVLAAALPVYDSGSPEEISGAVTLSGDILIDVGLVQTLGDYAYGVFAQNVGGAVYVHVDAAYTFGDRSGGVNAQAISANDLATGGVVSGEVVVVAGTVHTYGDFSRGVWVSGGVDGASVFAEDVLTFGVYSHGVAATGSGANLVSVDQVSTHGDHAMAVYVAVDGDASIIVGDAYTGGDFADAVSAFATQDVDIQAYNVVAFGDGSDGIVATAAWGSVTVEAGNVAVYGYLADAIRVTTYDFGEGGSQDTAVTVTGIVSSAYGAGIRANASGYSSITIDHGLVTGAYAGIVSTAGYATIIENDGGFIYGGSGLAIQVDGAFAQIDNSGVVYGRVDLTEGADLFYNNGIFEAYGTSAFGGGADRFENDGELRFGGLSGPASTTSFTGLETFNNTSLVTGVDGQAGDVLSMTGATFNGGAGSELALDVQFGGPGSIADRIVIGQATGVTNIVPNSVLAATPGVLNFAGILVVDSAFASETGAEFTMTTVDTGFVEYSLRFDATTDNWLIVGLPDTSVFRILALSRAMQDFWQRSSVAVNARWQETRDADGTPGLSAGPDGATGRSEGWEMWMQAHGGDEGFEDFETFSIGGSVFVENQSHNSDWRGFQFGADNRAGDFTWGLTGGFVQQETTFEVGGESFDIEGWNVGAYASWMSGGLFLNGLVKGDFNTVDANLTGVSDFETFDASSFGLQGELGYRLAGDAWFVEPVASLSWTSTRIDSFTTSGATLDFEDADSLVGKAGMRVGWTVGSGDVVLVPALGVFAIEEFEGENGMTFTTGATSFAITDTPPGAYGKVEFGVTAQTFYGLEGYVRGEVNFGDEADGGAVRLGARWRW